MMRTGGELPVEARTDLLLVGKFVSLGVAGRALDKFFVTQTPEPLLAEEDAIGALVRTVEFR